MTRPVRIAWLHLIVVAFLLLISNANDLLIRPNLEMSWKVATGEVRGVVPGGAADRAGIVDGDRLLLLEGQQIGTGRTPLHDVRAGQPVSVTYQRDQDSRQTTLTPATSEQARRRQLSLGGADSISAIASYVYIPLNLWMFALGVLIMARRSDSDQARMAAMALACWAGGNWLATASGAGAFLGSLPPSGRLAIYLLDAYVIAAFFAFSLHFALIFPSRTGPAAKHPWVLRLPYVLAFPIFAEVAMLAVRNSYVSTLAFLPDLRGGRFYSVLAPLILFLEVATLITKSRSIHEAHARRRLLLVLLAVVPGTLALTFLILMDQLGAPRLWRQIANLGQALGVTAGAAIFSYAIVRHQLFNIRFLVRRSIQYILARGTLLMAMLVPAVLAATFLYLHRDDSLSEIITGRPIRYLLIVIPLLAVLRYRKRLLESLDRRFFREHYDARQILLNLVSMIRSGSDTMTLSRAAVGEIEKALHPKHISLWLAEEDVAFRQQIVSEGPRPDPLPLTSALATLLSTDEEAIDLSSRSAQTLVKRLPAPEREWLEEADAHLIVPLLLEGRLAGFLLAGERKSENPYSSEDRTLLRTCAAQLALTIDYSRLKSSPALLWAPTAAHTLPSSDQTQLCPKCRRCFAADTTLCPADQSMLTAEEGVPHLIEDKYEMKQLLGRGGMGSVYLATQCRLHRDVAVKILHGHLLTSASIRNRFEREARILARLRHSSIVTIHDFGVLSSGHAYLVMELVQGETLRVHMHLRRLDPVEVLEILTPVGEAVSLAHQEGVVHRDLKPENIMLSQAGSGEVPRVLDFGLAKFAPPTSRETTTIVQSTEPGKIMGTLPYMAPELFRGAEADARSDQYSLGIIAYEMLSGSYPFDVSDLASIVLAHTEKVVPPISERAPGISSGMAAAIHRALEKESRSRFESTADFVHALGS